MEKATIAKSGTIPGRTMAVGGMLKEAFQSKTLHSN